MLFFDFWRSMQAMQKGLAPDTTTYVGPPSSDFFRFFKGQEPAADTVEGDGAPGTASGN